MSEDSRPAAEGDGPGAADASEPEPTVRLPSVAGPDPADTGDSAPGGPDEPGSGERSRGEPGSGGEPSRGEPGGGEPSGALRYAPSADEPGSFRAKRFWSSRRVPAAITAAITFGLAGLFLYDVASVRSGREGMHWRRKLADELATRHLDDVWVILGAAVCAALGLWLLVLALTPGERQVLPMARRGPEGVRAGLDRHAAELVLRDRAMEVSGIRWARVAVGRRRVTAKVSSHFRDLDDVRRDVSTALDDAVGQLGLAKAPSLRVHVQRAEKKA